MKQVFRVFWGCTLAAALALTGCGRGPACSQAYLRRCPATIS